MEEARIDVAVAQLICEARMKAGLTQKELAELIGTKEQLIARLEVLEVMEVMDYRAHFALHIAPECECTSSEK